MKPVLGIETSCDETAVAVATDATDISVSLVASQVKMHAPFGGVVPEIAAREHVLQLPRLITEAMRHAAIPYEALQAIAVTCGPGLATSLLTGIAAAQGLAWRLRLPLIAVNHIEAHLYSVFLTPNAPDWSKAMPLVALLVSGGHTCIVRADAPGRYRRLGATLDDAAGEAFDKGAQLLGLGYPGGPAIELCAKGGNPTAVRFPRGLARRKSSFDLSFSGLKTALRYYLEKQTVPMSNQRRADVAAAYQEAIVEALTERAVKATLHERLDTLAVAGGVSLNARLRVKLEEACAKHSLRLLLAAPMYCGDNAAMIAGLAAAGRGENCGIAGNVDAYPSLPLA